MTLKYVKKSGIEEFSTSRAIENQNWLIMSQPVDLDSMTMSEAGRECDFSKSLSLSLASFCNRP